MEEERSLAARENTELVLPGGSQEARLLEVVDNFKRYQRRQFRESWLGEKLNRFLFKENYEGEEREGWPLKGCWNFALVSSLWSLHCEASWHSRKLNGEEFGGFDMDYWIKRSPDGRFRLRKNKKWWFGLNPDGTICIPETNLAVSRTTNLAEIVQGDAKKLRQLYLEALILQLYKDYSRAPSERKECVRKDLLGCLPNGLSNFGIILEAMPNIPVYDGQKQGVIFKDGCAYRIAFKGSSQRKIEVTAYCLGYVNGEPFFELDARRLPFVTPCYLGQQGFVGLTISGKPVFVTEDGDLYTKVPQYIGSQIV